MKPILFSFNNIDIFTYPLLVGMAWGVAYNISLKLIYKRNQLLIKQFRLLFLGIFLFSWMGAKIFFLYFSKINNYQLYLTDTNFWLGGGFVFYGGLVFSIIFLYLYKIFFKEKGFQDFYLLIPGLCFGHAIGRLGCFLAGCCFGHLFQSENFLNSFIGQKHPVQIYESLFLFILGISSLKLIKANKEN